MTLTAKQSRFVNEYVNSLNGRQTAIAAGYSAKTARAIASENLGKPSIQAEIAKQEHLRQAHLNAALQSKIDELVKIAQIDLSKLFDRRGYYLPMAKWPPKAWSIVTSFKHGPTHASIKLIDLIKVLELLMEMTGAMRRRKNTERRHSGS